MTPPGATISSQMQERRGDADRLDRRVDADAARQRLDPLGRLAVGAVDRLRRAETPRDLQAVVVEIDHDDFGRRIELRREQRGEADRPRPDDRDARSGRDLAVQHAAFEAGRQNVAEHDERFLVGSVGNRIEARVGMRNADIFGLRAVDLVAEDPAAGRAMRINALAAIFAFAAGRNAGDQHAVAGLEGGDAGADAFDDADALVAEDPSRRAGRRHRP